MTSNKTQKEIDDLKAAFANFAEVLNEVCENQYILGENHKHIKAALESLAEVCPALNASQIVSRGNETEH